MPAEVKMDDAARAACRRRYRALWRLPFYAKILARRPSLPKLDEVLPQDPRLSTGVLACGTRYVVYVNRKPRHRAVLRLVIRVGSLAEDEDQLGIAHLLEHLVFRGTPSFPAGELKKFIEKCGMTWGADLNAETSMEQTSFTLEVPLGKTGMKLLKSALCILREFAFEALLRPQDVQKEKGVVQEEWRGRLGVEQRMEDKFWAGVLGESRHSKRLPIGSMEALKACPHERLLSFYRTWYRPENMAIIVVGDVGSNTAVVNMIKDIFSSVAPFPSPPAALPDPPLQATPRASIAYRDKELTNCQVRLRIFGSDGPRRTLRDVCNNTALELLLAGANRRFTALQGRPGAPFVAAMVSEEHLSQTYRCIVFTATVMQNSVRAAVVSLATAARSLARHSLSAHELRLVKKIHHTALDSVWVERHHLETDDIVEACEEYVTSNQKSRLCAEAMDVRLQQAALGHVGFETVTGGVQPLGALAEQLFSLAGGNWSVEAELPGDNDPDLDDTVLRALVSEVEQAGQDKILPFVWQAGEMLEEDVDGKGQLQLAASDVQGSILREDRLEHMDGQHMVLSNGATVTWMRTDFEPDEILIRGTAMGGTSELSLEAERSAALCLSGMRSLCGIGNLTKSQLGELLADCYATMLPGVSGYGRVLAGSSGASKKDFEMALRLAAWHFAPSNFTQSSLDKVMDLARERIKNRERDPGFHMQKKLRELTNGNDPFFRELSLEDIDGLQRLGLQGMRDLYGRLFADPGEWSWVIVGALPEDAIFQDLVTTFLGMPASTGKQAPAGGVSLTARIPVFTAGKVAQVHHGLAEAATVCVCYELDSANFPIAADRLAATCAAEVAEARLVEQLRIIAGATYGVSCSVSYGSSELSLQDRRPALSIEFGCDPSAVERCIAVVFEELSALLSEKAPITQDELDSCKEKERERHQVSERENSRWQGRLDYALLKTRCGTMDEDVVSETASAQSCPEDDCGRQKISVPILRAGLKGVMARKQRIEDLTQQALQEKMPCLFPAGHSITVTLLPERLMPDGLAKDPEDLSAKRQRIE